MNKVVFSGWRNHAYALAGSMLLILIWLLVSIQIPDGFFQQFRFDATLNTLLNLVLQPETYAHLWASLKRVIVGLILALLLGVPIGLCIGQNPVAEALSSQVFQFLRMISPLSWMPIAVMVFGIGDDPIYFLLAFAALWPIILNTAAGVKNVDPQLLKLAHSLDATPIERLRHIIWPSILSHILVGLRLAIGIVWIVLVPCEMLGVHSGLGYFILDARDRLNYTELLSIVIIIGLIGYLLDRGVLMLQRRRHLI